MRKSISWPNCEMKLCTDSLFFLRREMGREFAELFKIVMINTGIFILLMLVLAVVF